MRLAALSFIFALAAVAPGVSASTSANYAIPFASLVAGAGSMNSASYANASAPAQAIAGTSMGAAKTLTTGFSAQIYGLTNSCILDLDGNGQIDALTDGLMIMRAMFGLSGAAVTNNAIGAQATKTQWSDIQPLIHYSALDIDGDGKIDALSDGLILLRTLFGVTGTAVTTSALGAGATRTTFPTIRDYLNTVCAAAIQ